MPPTRHQNVTYSLQYFHICIDLKKLENMTHLLLYLYICINLQKNKDSIICARIFGTCITQQTGQAAPVGPAT